MDSFKTFGFTEDQFYKLLNQHPRSGATSVTNRSGHEELMKILNLRKKLIRTVLHAEFFMGYLRAGVIPLVLRIRNEPGLFTENKKFLEIWSHIANRCSWDWLILIIETAQEVIILERQQIEELEAALGQNTAVDDAKKKLEELAQDIEGYHDYQTNRKSTKLKKDIDNFSAELVYPFLQKDYYTTRKDQRWEKPQQTRQIYSRGGNRRITFSETSGSSEDEEQNN